MSGAGPQVTPTVSLGTGVSGLSLAEVETLVPGITFPSESVFWVQTLQTELGLDGNVSPLLHRHGYKAGTASRIVGVVIVVQLPGVSIILQDFANSTVRSPNWRVVSDEAGFGQISFV